MADTPDLNRRQFLELTGAAAIAGAAAMSATPVEASQANSGPFVSAPPMDTVRIGYVGIGDENTQHVAVNHASKEWVRGDVHSNTIESVWSLFKRSVIGSYHQVSVKHLPAYLDELEWRFNNRSNPYLFRDTVRAMTQADTLTVRKLIDGKQCAH